MGRLSEQTPPTCAGPMEAAGALTGGALEGPGPIRLQLPPHGGENWLVCALGSLCSVAVLHGATSPPVFVARERSKAWGLGSCSLPDEQDPWGFIFPGVSF